MSPTYMLVDPWMEEMVLRVLLAGALRRRPARTDGATTAAGALDDVAWWAAGYGCHELAELARCAVDDLEQGRLTTDGAERLARAIGELVDDGAEYLSWPALLVALLRACDDLARLERHDVAPEIHLDEEEDRAPPPPAFSIARHAPPQLLPSGVLSRPFASRVRSMAAT